MIITADIIAAIRKVANEYGLTLTDIQSRQRTRRLHVVRCKAARRARAHGASYSEIAFVMRRDHTTIMNMVTPKKAFGSVREREA